MEIDPQKLAAALIKIQELEQGKLPPPKERAEFVINREHRRVRRLALGATFHWLLGVALLLYLIYAFFTVLRPREFWWMKTYYGVDHLGRVPDLEPRILDAYFYAMLVSRGLLFAVIAALVLALAALGTVRLVFVTRRATVKQIQLGLAEVSEQLKELRDRLPPKT